MSAVLGIVSSLVPFFVSHFVLHRLGTIAAELTAQQGL